MINGKRIAVVMPAYNAERTLEQTVRELPDVVDIRILVDDGSSDHTASLSAKLGVRTFIHDANYGYGRNQQTCYREALAAGADIVVMVHPDYQYTPALVFSLAGMVANAEDRGLFTSASKVFTVLLTAIQAGAYILSGMFGSITGTATIVIFIELISAGVIVMLMDELVQKGWGLGSGISLFIMAGVAQSVVWDTFSPTTGLFVGSLNAWLNHSQTFYHWVLGEASGVYPCLLGFFATMAAFLIVIYLNGVRIELPMSYAGYKGFRSKYPIKLLYVSNLPVIFASALFANVYFF